MNIQSELDGFKVKPNRGGQWLIGSAAVLFVCGVLAVTLPLSFSVGLSGLLGCLVAIAAAAHLVFGIHFEAVHWTWHAFVAGLYGLAAISLLANPLLGVVFLALAVGLVLLVEGMIEVVLFFILREYRHVVWILVDGVITFVLGLVACAHWPPASLEAIHYLVGISLILSGISRLLLGLTIRELAPADTPER
jgi:uncharacterized membrane protein HdeD (DUF308 family)